MIKDNIKVHDNFSIEIKLIYENIFKKKKTRYDTITYLFVPNGLNINSQTYTQAKFYNDVKVYIRYEAPYYELNELLELATSPLNNLNAIAYQLNSKKATKQRRLELQSATKMLGAVLNKALIAKISDIKKHKEQNIPAFLQLLDKVITDYRNIIKRYDKINKDPKRILELGDEYISNITSYYLINFHQYCLDNNVNNESLQEIVKFISEEQKYRKARDYDIDNEDDFYDESLLYKRSQLKKYIESVLFLNRDVRKDGTFFEQSVFAISAGIAMIFSTAIAFYYQSIYGNFTLPFFVALVIGYMFKDRIKSLVGMMFISRANSLFYDYKVKIKDAKNNNIGKIKENFTFVPLNKLGPKVKIHRFKENLLQTDYDLNGEQIIQYKKKITLYPGKFGKEISDSRLNNLVDITRINLYRFISQMDDPKRKYSLVKKGKIITRVGNRVYHINIIQKFYTENGIEFKRYRVIMNRKGIKRIEKVDLDYIY
jgi:hypothetical protein